MEIENILIVILGGILGGIAGSTFILSFKAIYNRSDDLRLGIGLFIISLICIGFIVLII